MKKSLHDETTQRLQSLSTMDRPALVNDWTSTYGRPPPRRAHLALLRGALAWELQVEMEASGETAKILRRLRRQAVTSASTQVLSPGTRLLRDWHGQTHHVTVVPNGFEYQGAVYLSLTAIARLITGTAWSGPAFFGLRK